MLGPEYEVVGGAPPDPGGKGALVMLSSSVIGTSKPPTAPEEHMKTALLPSGRAEIKLACSRQVVFFFVFLSNPLVVRSILPRSVNGGESRPGAEKATPEERGSRQASIVLSYSGPPQ